ncbi:MAG: sensor domain-containing diguanylate cyclase [Candidatus Omnitrophota bacterium]|nr:sensor domain-containing diguanylate cyclase [Candidatus Omnitrophota bacterium]MBU2034576.1 sensor domain-containing diguanylate cyclase [Candidatus Omnitrophota bacterium]
MAKEKINNSLISNEHIFDLVLEICNYIESINSVTDIDGIIAAFVKKIGELFNINRVSCMLIDETRGELYLKAALGLDPSLAKASIKLGESFAGRVAKEGVPFLVKNVREEFPELGEQRLSRYLTSSFLIVPLKTRNKVVGVLSLTDKKNKYSFSENDLKTINFISQHLALYIENIRLSDRNKSLSRTDPLTNLANHRYFHEQLQEEIYRAERYSRPLAILMIDIDNFSNYNQIHGYAGGDSVLQQVGMIIKDSRRLVDFVSRYGPEEFAIILPETKRKEAVFTAERIREKVAASVFTDDSQRKSPLGLERLTVSIGVVEHKIGITSEELIQRLLLVLKEAKQKGKNCVCAYSK